MMQWIDPRDARGAYLRMCTHMWKPDDEHDTDIEMGGNFERWSLQSVGAMVYLRPTGDGEREREREPQREHFLFRPYSTIPG